MSKETSLVKDLLARAFHTAYQAGVATFGVLWAQSDLHLSDLEHGAGWARLWSSVIVGVIAAVVSALKTSGLAFVGARREKLVQQGRDEILATIPKVEADLSSGDVTAAMADVKAAATAVEAETVATLEPTSIDGAHPAASDPDNK